jgi:hypothetical protein
MAFAERTATLAGVQVAWIAADEAGAVVADRLARDFAAFPAEPATSARTLSFRLAQTPAGTLPPAPRLTWRWKGIRFRGAGARRSIWYPGGADCRWRFSARERECTLRFADPDHGHALAYDATLSALGEALECEGWHRAHGLGLRHRPTGFAALLLMPPGGGKSTLARLALQDPEFDLYSDESPLLAASRGELRIRAFPLRLAVVAPDPARLLAAEDRIVRPGGGAKRLFEFPRARVAPTESLGLLMVGGSGGFAPRFTATADLIAGLGLAQMGEHLLRWDATGSLPAMLRGRLRNWSAARRLPIEGFPRRGDPAASWAELRGRILAAAGVEAARKR